MNEENTTVVIPNTEFKLYDYYDHTLEVATGTTDSSGVVTFEHVIPGRYYLKQIPRMNSDGSTSHLTEVDASPKCSITTTNSDEITVQKQWLDQTNQQQKCPPFIKVSLLKGTTIIDEQVLRPANNWSYTWSNLVPSAGYTIKETTESKYYHNLETKLEKSGHTWTYTIVNQYSYPEDVPTDDLLQNGKWLTVMVISIVDIALCCLKRFLSK